MVISPTDTDSDRKRETEFAVHLRGGAAVDMTPKLAGFTEARYTLVDNR